MADRPPQRRRRPAAGQTPPEMGSEKPQEAPSRPEPPPPMAAPGKGSTVLQKKLERMIVALGFPFAAAGDMHCARIFAQRGPVVAEAWATLASESPAVKEALEAMLKGGAWTGAIGATIGLMIPVASHHGAPIPAAARMVFGAPPEEPHEHTEPTPESEPAPFIPHPTTNGHTNGNGVPGPAAVSFAPSRGEGADPTDPTVYPGN